MKSVDQIVNKIASSEKVFTDSLFKPVTFQDGTIGTYNGFVQSRTKNHVKIRYMGKDLFVRRDGFIGQWSKRDDGKVFYQYVLDPFGPDVCYSDSRYAGDRIAVKFLSRGQS